MALKHQLNIHLDYGPSTAVVGSLEIRYGYHHSGKHQLREQVLRIDRGALASGLLADLDAVYMALQGRIPDPVEVPLPHAVVKPTVRAAGLTFVVLDQTRADRLPMARLYFYEEVVAIGSSIEDQVRVERSDWTEQELVICARLQQAVRKLAWDDYSRLIGHHLLGSAEDGA